MPEENLRMVCTGAPRADKAFDVFLSERNRAELAEVDLARESELAAAQVKRALQTIKANRLRAKRGAR